VDGGLTAGHWVHPDAGPGAIDALASLVGVEKYSDIDGVYHARR
jgi:hypothetical protein